jgi:hypothetical protein
VETFWIWPLVVLGVWIAAYIGGKPVLAVVAGGSVAFGLSIQSASGYRQEIRSGALELVMTTPVRTASYFLNRVCLGLREFGLALLLHGVLSVLAIWVWGPIGQPSGGGWPWMPTLRPELLLWPLLAVFASPAAGLLTSARLANLPAGDSLQCRARAAVPDVGWSGPRVVGMASVMDRVPDGRVSGPSRVDDPCRDPGAALARVRRHADASRLSHG